MNIKIVFTTFLFSWSFCSGQELEFNLDTLMKNSIVHFKQGIPSELITSELYGNDLLENLSKYYRDVDPKTRLHAYRLTLDIAIKNLNLKIRMNAMENVLEASYDTEHTVKEYFSGVYETLPKEIFSEIFRNKLKKLLHDDENVNRSHLLLAGFLDMVEEIEYIRTHFAVQGASFKNEFLLSYFNSIHFAAHLALARMGEKESIEYVLTKIKREKPDDIVQKRLKQVAFIKQPEAMEFIFEYLFSDETFPPEYPGGEGKKYAMFAVYELSDCTINFPKLKMYYPPVEDIETARNWVATNRNNYKINRETW